MKKVHVVSHTHWDREWYFTIEDSNILLGENFAKILSTLENIPEYNSYTLDAQSSLIEEYLKIKPENYERVKNVISNKKLFVGPWYTQTDTLLVNKESLIRNLFYGTTIAKKFDHSLNVGYLPDTFGQNAYLPSIFKNFGIDYSVLKRGIFLKDLKNNDNFTWISPDGKSIPSNYMSLGYGSGELLNSDETYVKEKLLPILNSLNNNNIDNDNILLFVGGDQTLINSILVDELAKINSLQDKFNLETSSLEKFMEEATSQDNFERKIYGELRDTGNQRVHRTIGSMRYDIKKLNSRIENKILNILEPLYSIGKSFGVDYPQTWLDFIWKNLFDAHAHDSMGCCNSDDTNREVKNRLIKSERIVDGLINLIKKRVIKSISKTIGKENIFVLFNTNIKENNEFNKGVLFTKSKYFSIEDLSGKKVTFEKNSQKYINGGKKIILTENGNIEEEMPGYYRTEITLKTAVHSMGWKTFVINDIEKDDILTKEDKDNTIKNENLKLIVNSDSIDIFFKEIELKDCIYFENCADFGDSYDFSPLENDTPFIIKNFEIVSREIKENLEKIEVLTKVTLPKNLDNRIAKINDVEFEIITVFELRKGEKYIRIKHNILNNIEDHRVRCVFKTPFTQLNNSYSDSGFSLIEHKTDIEEMKTWREDNYVEAPVPIYNMENIALVKKNNLVMGTIVEGLKEYEILDNSHLALTLFRSVGLLGRDNLLWRPNRASGINNTTVYTPDAQIQGKLEFEYALYFDNILRDSEIFKNVEKYLKALTYYQNQELDSLDERLDRFNIPLLERNLLPEYSLFSIDNSNIFMSMCKTNGEDIVIRLFNPENTEEKVKILSENISSITETNLGEIEEKEIEKIVIEPKGYITLKLKLKKEENERQNSSI